MLATYFYFCGFDTIINSSLFTQSRVDTPLASALLGEFLYL